MKLFFNSKLCWDEDFRAFNRIYWEKAAEKVSHKYFEIKKLYFNLKLCWDEDFTAFNRIFWERAAVKGSH